MYVGVVLQIYFAKPMLFSKYINSKGYLLDTIQNECRFLNSPRRERLPVAAGNGQLQNYSIARLLCA